LRELGILLRPHPKRGEQWDSVIFDDLEQVSVWPAGGRVPVDAVDRADFFDSIFHSAAVFGINTSAMIEAAIVGRPVLTLLLPEFAGSQTGVFHFQYLRDVAGGVLTVAEDADEHFGQLADVLANGASGDARGFVEAFVRPRGLAVRAAAVFADEVERVAAGSAGAKQPPLASRAARPALRILGPWYARHVARRRERRRGRRARA
jgi:hypothetical protein